MRTNGSPSEGLETKGNALPQGSHTFMQGKKKNKTLREKRKEKAATRSKGHPKDRLGRPHCQKSPNRN